MKFLLLFFSAVVLSGCTAQSIDRCVYSGDTIVMVRELQYGALDGHEYLICPIIDTECDKYNRLKSERPKLLKVKIDGARIMVEQAGGSVTKFSSDPIGMRNPQFQSTPQLYFAFQSAAEQETGLVAYIGSRPTAFSSCGKLR